MLTDVACRTALAGPKPRKLADSGGLHLLVAPSGHRSWRMKYRFGGREKQLTIGPYPEVSLREARAVRDTARVQLRAGIDPAAVKARAKLAAATAALDSFEAVARAWHRAKAPALNARYAAQVLERLAAEAFPRFGRTPLREVTPPMVLAALRAVEARGAIEMAHRLRMHISDVFVWAIASGLAEHDPAAQVRKALLPKQPRLRPAAVKIEHARAVLAAVERSTRASPATLLASRLLALTAMRPGVVRLAEAGEFEGLDGPEPLWRVPAAKMKLSRDRKRDAAWEFVQPLSHQAAALARAAIATSPACAQDRHPRWLFPGAQGWRKPISDSTLSQLYLDAGFRGEHVPHGWRATFSTIMNERAAIAGEAGDRAIIDMMLAHAPKGVEPAYNRAQFMPRRRVIAQEWADLLLEGLPPPEALLEGPRRRR